MQQMTHRPDIDGLRAVAIVSVLLFHLRIGPFGGGYVGVDVFFVISGYLIASIIHADLKRGQFSIAAFYERRIRRIFPALGVLLAVNLTVAPLILDKIDLRSFAKSAVAALLFVSNMHFAGEIGYFDTPAEIKPLLHTWSLGVEEQWYLLFPLLLAFVHRRAGVRSFLWLAPLALISILAGYLLAHRYPQIAFFLMPTRAWQLLMGAILALATLSPPRQRVRREVLSLTGMAAIVVSVLDDSSSAVFPGINTVLPCVGAVLLLHSGTGGTSTIGLLLSARPVVFTGLISYSLYLWHWPIIVYRRYLWPGETSPLDTALMIALAAVLAAASWRWIEQPFRRREIVKARSSVFRFFVVTSVVLGVAGSALYVDAKRQLNWLDQALRDDAAEKQKLRLGKCDLTESERASFGNLCASFGDPGARKRMVVWGDSHAGAWLPALAKVAQENGYSAILISVPGCPPVIGVRRLDGFGNANCADGRLSSAILAYIKRLRPETTVLVARWQLYTHGLMWKGRLQPATHFLSGEDSASKTADESRGVLQSKLRSTLAELKPATNVVIIRSVPELPDTAFSLYERGPREGKHVGATRQAHDAAQAFANTLISRLESDGLARAFDPANVLCPQAECLYADGGIFYYFDESHITYAANMLFIDQLKRLLPAR
jgi:peptidoglycan/LPS O-acetylase OafA/YrhL